MPVVVDFVAVSSYGQATRSSGVVRILKDVDESVTGRQLLLVEDIVDSGLTLKYLSEYLRAKQPADLRVCTLLDKPDRREYTSSIQIRMAGSEASLVKEDAEEEDWCPLTAT